LIFDLTSQGRPYDYLHNVNHGDTVLDQAEADFGVLEFLSDRQKDVTFVSGDINLESNIKRVKHQFEVLSDPWWYIQTKAGLKNRLDFQPDFRYNVIFMSGEPRYSRIITMRRLHKYDRFVYSNLNPLESVETKNLRCNGWNSEHLVNFRFPDFDPKQKLLTEEGDCILEYAPMEYWESVIDLVGEPYTHHGASVTEKTFKPLFWQKPFLILGGQGIHTFLKNEGFELYDEIFDYSFDNEPFCVRWHSIMNQMKVILETDTQEFASYIHRNFDIAYKIKHNYELIRTVRSRPLRFTF
tara:strand:+ start:1153 stop:2043 length:891 start_codon:yes stop_codon:yes gene_type:complete